jgi:hypothetical protein
MMVVLDYCFGCWLLLKEQAWLSVGTTPQDMVPAAHAHSCSPEPMLKVIANLAGARMIMGRKRKKAISRNTAPALKMRASR